jgi:hypothetical protein
MKRRLIIESNPRAAQERRRSRGSAILSQIGAVAGIANIIIGAEMLRQGETVLGSALITGGSSNLLGAVLLRSQGLDLERQAREENQQVTSDLAQGPAMPQLVTANPYEQAPVARYQPGQYGRASLGRTSAAA